MKIIVLVENMTYNKAPKGIKSEHGLSLYIEACGKKVLFDTGQSELFIHNAEKIGINISEVDYLIISHGHMDHGGGIKHFFKVNNKAKVIMHKDSKGKFYTKILGFLPIYIGLDLKILGDYSHRITYIQQDFDIATGISLSVGIPANFPQPESNRHLYVKKENHFIQDNFNHEIILNIKESDGCVLFTACSHSGIINMINRYTEDRLIPIKAIFGGFHLYNPMSKKNEKSSYINLLIKELQKFDTIFFTGHCTGMRNYISIKSILKEKIQYFHSGQTFEL